MLTIAGGIVIGLILFALLPYILEFVVKAFLPTLLIVVGAVALLFLSQEPKLVLWLVPVLPAWLLFSLFKSINKHGGVRGWFEYLGIEFRRTRTAEDIARRARDLQAHAARVEDAKRRREADTVDCATAKLIAQVEKKIARLAPNAPVRMEKGVFDHRVFAGDVEIGGVDIKGKNLFVTSVSGTYSRGDASETAAHLRGSLRRKLRASSDLVESLRMGLTTKV